MLPLRNTPSPFETLVRYLMLCAACHKKDGKAIDPDGEVLE